MYKYTPSPRDFTYIITQSGCSATLLYSTIALEINNADENKYVAIRKYEQEKMRKERKCRMRNNQKEKQKQELKDNRISISRISWNRSRRITGLVSVE